jgi:hypothetical protein
MSLRRRVFNPIELLDGAARLVAIGIPPDTWRALRTRAGGESVGRF